MDNTMKIVTLNIRHGGGTRVPAILQYLSTQDADVIVLTEYRDNANAAEMRFGLLEQGLIHFSASAIDAKTNSVGIFSRRPFEPRTYPYLAFNDRHRLVSARIDDLEIFGVYFAQNRAKAGLFQFILDGAYKPAAPAHLFIGDFNTGLHGIDEEGSTFYCAEQFAALPAAGLIDSWRSRNTAERDYSWYSQAGNGFRIDHVFSSGTADSRIENAYYDHIPRESGITDHSALVVEIVS
jgi:exonuclease III